MKTNPRPKVATKKKAPAGPKCALPGCEIHLHVASTGRPGKYCCDLHRALAAKLRAREERNSPGTNNVQHRELVVAANDQRSARPDGGQAVGLSDTAAAAHQIGRGSSTVRYTSVLHLHVRETREESTPTTEAA